MQIALKNDLKEIERLLDSVQEWGAAQDLPARLVFDLQLVLDELFTNIVNYGYDDAAEHRVLVDLETAGEELTLRVTDDARPFNPLERKDPDVTLPLEERPVGGLGIFLIRKLMNHVEYHREEGKNILTMRRSTRAPT